MKPSVFDPCFLNKLSDSGFQGIHATQVDDTLGGGDDEFSALEEKTSKDLSASHVQILFLFNATVFGLTNTNQEAIVCTKKTFFIHSRSKLR